MHAELWGEFRMWKVGSNNDDLQRKKVISSSKWFIIKIA